MSADRVDGDCYRMHNQKSVKFYTMTHVNHTCRLFFSPSFCYQNRQLLLLFLQGFTVLRFDCNQPLYTQSINQNKQKQEQKNKNKQQQKTTHVRKQGKHSENFTIFTMRVLSDTHKPVKHMPYTGDKQTPQTTTSK